MTTTPEGWYPDPNNASQQRYWNGTAWTEQMRPAQPVPAGPHQARAQAKADRAYRKASRRWPLRHPILSLIGAVIVIAIIAAAASGGGSSNNSPQSGTSANGSAANQSNNETNGKVLQHVSDVKIVKCSRDQFGYLNARVKITNHSSKASDYVVTVAFESKNGSQQIDTGSALVDSLQPGQSTTQDASATRSYGKPFRCVLSKADRARLVRELAAIETRLTRLTQDLASGLVHTTEYRSARDAFHAERERLKAALATTEAAVVRPAPTRREISRLLDGWDGSDELGRNRALRDLVWKVEITPPATRGRNARSGIRVFGAWERP